MLPHGLVALLLIIIVSVVDAQSLALRIAGGVKAKLGDFPHTAAIKNRNSQIVYCSGSIIHKRYILIAAHCNYPDPANPGYYDAANTVAIFGRVRHDNATTGFVVNLESITFHHQYDDRNAKNDIALMRMDRDVLESEYVKYLYLQPSQIALGTQVWAAGWGRMPDMSLPKDQYKVQLKLVRGNMCTGHGPFFSPQMICAGEGNGKDTCEGDSGSSIVYRNPVISNRWIGIGLTSFGGNPCGGHGVRGTYTNVSNYIPWVQSQIPDWTQPLDIPSNITTTAEPETEIPTTIEPDTTEEPYTEEPYTEEPEEEIEDLKDPEISDFWYVFRKVFIYFISSVTSV